MSSTRQSLLMIFLVALAFALSSFTRFRFPGLPVGMAEVILIGCIIVHIPMGLGIHGGNQPNRFMPFLVPDAGGHIARILCHCHQ